VVLHSPKRSVLKYSCFKKGCPTKVQKRTRQCRKVLWVMASNGCLIEAKGISSWQSDTAQARIFVIFSLKYCWPQTRNAKLLLPIFGTISIGIVAFAFTLVWDSVCRNRCICFPSTRKLKAGVFKFLRFEERFRKAPFSGRITPPDRRPNRRNKALCVFKFLRRSVDGAWSKPRCQWAPPNKRFNEENNGCTSVFSKPLYSS